MERLMKTCCKCGDPYLGARCAPCRSARRRALWVALSPSQRHKECARHYAGQVARGYLSRPDVRERINAQKRARRAAMTEVERAIERPGNNARVLSWIARRRDEHNAWRRTRYQAQLQEQRRVGRAYAARRRARKVISGGAHTPQEWLEKCALLGNSCIYCGVAGLLTVDHKTPLARGGSNGITNVVPACFPCNRHKGTMTAQEYVASLRSSRMVA